MTQTDRIASRPPVVHLQPPFDKTKEPLFSDEGTPERWSRPFSVPLGKGPRTRLRFAYMRVPVALCFEIMGWRQIRSAQIFVESFLLPPRNRHMPTTISPTSPRRPLTFHDLARRLSVNLSRPFAPSVASAPRICSNSALWSTIRTVLDIWKWKSSTTSSRNVRVIHVCLQVKRDVDRTELVFVSSKNSCYSVPALVYIDAFVDGVQPVRQ